MAGVSRWLAKRVPTRTRRCPKKEPAKWRTRTGGCDEGCVVPREMLNAHLAPRHPQNRWFSCWQHARTHIMALGTRPSTSTHRISSIPTGAKWILPIHSMWGITYSTCFHGEIRVSPMLSALEAIPAAGSSPPKKLTGPLHPNPNVTCFKQGICAVPWEFLNIYWLLRGNQNDSNHLKGSECGRTKPSVCMNWPQSAA